MKLSEWQMFDTTKVNKSGRRVILYLFAEVKGHNHYYSVWEKNVYRADKSTKFCTEVGFIVYIMKLTGSKIFGKYFGVYGRATSKQTRKF